MSPPRPAPSDAWTRPRSRREVLRLGAAIAAGGVLAPLLAACGSGPGGPSASGAPSAGGSAAASGASVTGQVTLLTVGGNPTAEPALKGVFDEFRALYPGVGWDIRPIPGGGPEWDRLARASIAAGEPVGLVFINGQQVRGWVRDGLLAPLGEDPATSAVLARVPPQFQLTGPGETTVRAVPLAVTRGVHTTGLYYNQAILDRAGLAVPMSIADLEAMVQPLKALGVAPLVHCSGDVYFNQMLVTWILPMIAERSGDPLEFAERTVRGDIGYDSPEWIETLQAIVDLRRSGVLMDGSGAVDYGTMQQLFLSGKVAATYQGTWLLPELLKASPRAEFDLHVAPPPLVDGATRSRALLAWTGAALPAGTPHSREAVLAFLEYASRAEVDRAVVRGLQTYSPIQASNVEISDPIAREFLPMFDDAITPLDWLWEPEIKDELDRQVQALVRGDTDPAAVGKAVNAVAAELRSSGRSYYS